MPLFGSKRILLKKIFTLMPIYLIAFLVGDIIFSNFFYLKAVKYGCIKKYEYFYELEKNCIAYEKLIGSVSPYKVFTDSNGYRYSGKKRNNLKDKVLFVGDSHTFGFGVPYQDSFPGIVETRIQQYEIYNLGVPGYGIRMYWNTVEDFFLNTKMM